MYYYDKFHMHRLNRSHFIKNHKIEQKKYEKTRRKMGVVNYFQNSFYI